MTSRPCGAAQSVLAVPYYRDDACFDDGTGSDPGIELFPREADKEKLSGANGARNCWRGAAGGHATVPNGDPRFWQGSIATHGIHILFLADSDNARQTVPVSEIVAETRMVMLPGVRTGDAGERYGRGFEKQAVSFAAPTLLSPAPAGEKPQQAPAPSEQPTKAATDSPSTSGSASPSPAPSRPGAKPGASKRKHKLTPKQRCRAARHMSKAKRRKACHAYRVARHRAKQKASKHRG